MQIEQLDKIMRSIAGEVARYQEMSSIAERIMRGGQGDRIAAIDAAIVELESKKFGEKSAEVAYKTSDNYREFVEANRVTARPMPRSPSPTPLPIHQHIREALPSDTALSRSPSRGGLVRDWS